MASLTIEKDVALNNIQEDSRAIHDTSDAGSPKTLSHAESGSEPDLATIEGIYKYVFPPIITRDEANIASQGNWTVASSRPSGCCTFSAPPSDRM
jgi:hypothetical protein